MHHILCSSLLTSCLLDIPPRWAPSACASGRRNGYPPWGLKALALSSGPLMDPDHAAAAAVAAVPQTPTMPCKKKKNKKNMQLHQVIFQAAYWTAFFILSFFFLDFSGPCSGFPGLIANVKTQIKRLFVPLFL